MGTRMGLEERQVRALEKIAKSLQRMTMTPAEAEATRDARMKELSAEARDWRVRYREAQAELNDLQHGIGDSERDGQKAGGKRNEA